jgi:hypothetical protein
MEREGRGEREGEWRVGRGKGLEVEKSYKVSKLEANSLIPV